MGNETSAILVITFSWDRERTRAVQGLMRNQKCYRDFPQTFRLAGGWYGSRDSLLAVKGRSLYSSACFPSCFYLSFRAIISPSGYKGLQYARNLQGRAKFGDCCVQHAGNSRLVQPQRLHCSQTILIIQHV